MRSILPSLSICSIDEIRSDLSAGLVTLSVASCDVFSPRRRADVLEVPYDIYVVTDIADEGGGSPKLIQSELGLFGRR